MQILWVFETDVFDVQKGLFAIYNVENRFFTIYFHDLSHGNTSGYKGLQGVTGGYKEFQGVTAGYKGFQGVTGGDKGLQGVSKDYRNFSLTRTFPDTFSWSILHQNQS